MPGRDATSRGPSVGPSMTVEACVARCCLRRGPAWLVVPAYLPASDTSDTGRPGIGQVPRRQTPQTNGSGHKSPHVALTISVLISFNKYIYTIPSKIIHFSLTPRPTHCTLRVHMEHLIGFWARFYVSVYWHQPGTQAAPALGLADNSGCLRRIPWFIG